MFVGSASIELLIPQSNSLKSKRQVLKTLKDRLHNKFDVSVAEVDHNDLWQRALIGVAVVANQNNFARQVLSEVLEYIQRENGVEVINYNIEIL
jgi:uncharacterized protein YlxP (DUF503 family)